MVMMTESKDKILADVDDLLYNMKKTIQKRYKLTWSKATDHVNNSIKQLYEIKK